MSNAPGVNPETFPFDVYPDFISEAEHDMLLKYFHKKLRRHPYEYEHLDKVIHGFRELSRSYSLLPPEIMAICERMFEYFPDKEKIQPQLHILDLEEGGEIGRHVDSVKFCGSHIAGVCLGTSAVMTLHHEHSDATISIQLPKRGFYVMHDEARWDYGHGVSAALNGDTRGRRISLLVRNEAEAERRPVEYDLKIDPAILAEFEEAKKDLAKPNE